MSQGAIQQKEQKAGISEEYDLPEALLKECKKSFDLFDLNTSGRINSSLISGYLATVSKTNIIHYLLDGIEGLGEEIKYEDYLRHVKVKLRNSQSEEFYQKVAAFVELSKGGKVEIGGMKKLAQELGLDLSEFEVNEVLGTLDRMESD